MLRVAAPAASLLAFHVLTNTVLVTGPKMLFKTISASVYGIDAYLVEVEVDVGSARMQDSAASFWGSFLSPDGIGE
jgi:hypothetical protein